LFGSEARNRTDEPAKRPCLHRRVGRDRLRQGLAAGALTGGVAALLITILIFGTMVVLHRQSPAPSTEELMSVLFLGPLLGMALGLGGGSLPALCQPKPAPPSPLLREPAPDSSVT
jgi:hypothetical protein